jgi:Concanavalin A-like lectin/glucanases superfamily
MSLTIRSAQTISNGVTLIGSTSTITPPPPFLPSILFELDASTYTTGDWIDSTGNGRNGLMVGGGPSWSSDAGGCFNFTAINGVYISVTDSLSGWGLAGAPAQATFSVWANIPGISGYQHVAGWRGGLNFWFLILSGMSTTEARFDNGTARDIGIDYSPYFNNWALTTFVVDAVAGESRLYINGVFVGNAGGISGNFSAGGTAFTLGSDSSSNFMMTGKIGGAMAYNATLTQPQIVAEFNRTKTRYGL